MAGSKHEAPQSDTVARDRRVLLQNYGARDLALVRGSGSYVFDEVGNRYLDCVSGIAVNTLGHCHPAVTEAIRRQAGELVHASNLYLLGPQLELAELLVKASGFSRVFFCNSGTEANEGAIKFARKYWVSQGQTDRDEIISLTQSFHGRTYGALAATGQEKLRQGFGPMPGGFRTVEVNNATALRDALSPKTAAIIFEPVLAEGGVIELSLEFAQLLGTVQARGILLIADEIQTGIGRTGAFLAAPYLALQPDITTLAKPLGGGLPLGAVLLRERIAAAIAPGDHGTTFGGNPVACAAGVAVVGEVLKPGFLDAVGERSRQLREGLTKLLERHVPEGEKDRDGRPKVRGRGLLVGFALRRDVGPLLAACRRQGLLIHKAGTEVARLLPPLNISAAEVDELLEKLELALQETGA